MRFLGTIAALVLLSAPLQASRPAFSVDGSLKLSSAYLWRGDYVCGLHFNPDVCFHIGNFTVENYDFLSLDGQYKEIDWDLSWKLGDFTLHLADYYARYASYEMPESFFSWKMGQTNHIDEVALVYDCPAFPLTAKWFTFFWGDWAYEEVSGTPVGVSFSSYLELETWYDAGKWGKGVLNLGASVFKGAYTGYTKGFMPVHIELRYEKEFGLGEIQLPLGVSFMVNPYNRCCYAAAWAGIAF